MKNEENENKNKNKFARVTNIIDGIVYERANASGRWKPVRLVSYFANNTLANTALRYSNRNRN